MGYKLVSAPDEIAAAFQKLRRMLGVEEDRAVREHERHGFWAEGVLPDKPKKTRKNAVRLGLLGEEEYARITVKPEKPLEVAGLIVMDDEKRKHIAHSGIFSTKGQGQGTVQFRENTKGDRAWIGVEQAGDRGRFLITRIDDIDEEELLGNVSRFVQKRFIPTDVDKIEHVPQVPTSEAAVPLNRVFCGPPGTGKTFHAISEAVKVIDGKLPAEVDRVPRFRNYRDDGRVELVTFHQNYDYEDFIEGIRPALNDRGDIRYELHDGIFKRIAKRASENLGNRYVLVIDEINRGNIAKIFGELITLIEPSKRLGRDDEAQATLPHSGDTFGVPANLYMIGTMNTADRGIALLDVALRRRFEFDERMPNAALVTWNIEGVTDSDLLEAINQRIVENLDREHQIGHTYLMKVDNMEGLARIFRTQIIPLLQEYFYDDWEKIRSVLNNNAFITKRGVEERSVFDVLAPGDGRWRDPANYQAIYNSSGGGATKDE